MITGELHHGAVAHYEARMLFWKRAFWFIVLGVLCWSSAASLATLGHIWGDTHLVHVWVMANIPHCLLRGLTVCWLMASHRHRPAHPA